LIDTLLKVENKRSEIIHCQCCARQIVSYEVNDKFTIGGKPSYRMLKGFCCYECGKDLNEHGLFPEEKAMWESLKT
jgi:hypothetical protein